jgi:DNA-binding SARP family transcriptional activator
MLRIQLLGQSRIDYDGAPQHIRAKSLALLIYVLHQRRVSRDEIDHLFAVNTPKNWWDILEPLGDLKATLRTRGKQVEFLPPDGYWCDLEEFIRLTDNVSAQTVDGLLAAFDLYGGELSLKKPQFTHQELLDWLEAFRRELARRYVELCERLEKDLASQREAEKLLYVIERVKNPSQRRQKEHRLLRLHLLGILGRDEDVEREARQMERVALPEEQAHIRTVLEKIRQREGNPFLVHDLWQAVVRSDLHCPTPAKPAVLRSGARLTYVGRPELDALRQVVEQPRPAGQQPRIVVLVGMGGVGKSTLVRQLALQDGDRLFRNGVLWGNLDADTDETSILRDWVGRLSQGSNPSVSLDDRIKDLTSACERLVVIEDDGAYSRDTQFYLPEHLDKVMIKIRRLLPVGASNTVIITTRNRAIYERLCQDRLHDASENVTLAQINSVDDSVGVNIACRYANFAISIEEARPLVGALEGLPLALEMAGRYINQQLMRHAEGTRVTAYLERFYAKRALLVDVLPVTATLDISRDALTRRLRDMFDELAVFDTRPFDARAAAAVWETTPDQAERNLDKLAMLSLVGHEDGRWRLHAVVARFALEYLENSDRYPIARRHMIDYYLVLPETDTPLRELLPERAALEHCLEAAFESRLYADFMSCVERSHRLWTSQGFYDTARAMYRAAAEAAAALGDRPRQAHFLALASETLLEQGGADEYAQAARWIAEAEGLLTDADLTARFWVQRAKVRWALQTQDTQIRMRDELAKLDTMMEEVADALSPELQISYIEARSWIMDQMFSEGRQREPETIELLLELTVHLIDQISKFPGGYVRDVNLIRCLSKQNGVLLWTLKRFHDTPQRLEANFMRASALCEQIGEYAELAPLLNYHIIFARNSGDLERALELSSQCEQMNRTMGDYRGLSRTLRSQSIIYERKELWEQAYAKARECSNLYKRLGLNAIQFGSYIKVLTAQGHYAHASGNKDWAVAAWEEVLSADEKLLRSVQEEYQLCQLYLNIVNLMEHGEVDQAVKLNSQLDSSKQLLINF